MSYNLRTGLMGSSEVDFNVNLQNLSADNITSGVFHVDRIPTLAKTKISGTGTWAASDIPLLDASKIGTGTLVTDRIPSLDASKIDAGTLNADRIPALDEGKIGELPASKITSGTFNTTLIPDLDASKITTGLIDNARIPHLDASKISVGTFAVARIPALPYLSAETITMTDFKTVVATSSDFADFISRVSVL